MNAIRSAFCFLCVIFTTVNKDGSLRRYVPYLRRYGTGSRTYSFFFHHKGTKCTKSSQRIPCKSEQSPSATDICEDVAEEILFFPFIFPTRPPPPQVNMGRGCFNILRSIFSR